MNPLEKYQESLASGILIADPYQANAVKHTQRLFDEMVQQHEETANSGLFKKLWLNNAKKPIKGLYFWGDVGRGKTYLIDSLFECIPFEDKLRVHYGTFFKALHERLQNMPKSPDPLTVIANEFAKQCRLLCIDEFHVDDITDAMIIAGLLEASLKQGMTIIATSNTPIEKLYRNGLQRDRFLPAIGLLLEHTEEVHLDGDQDYRCNQIERFGVFHVTNSNEVPESFKNEYQQLAPHAPIEEKTLQINNRDINVVSHTGHIIWFDFDALCNTPRSSSDYLDLAKTYHTVFLSNVRALDDGQNDIAQRFIQLIDALYDHQAKLIMHTSSPIDALYRGETLNFPFQRTLSRLNAMRSEAYLHQAHRHG